MKGVIVGLLSLIIFISGCTSTVQEQSRNLASALKLETSFTYVNSTTPKIIINITSNESIQNATAIITLSKELTEDNTITWTGNITKNEPIMIEAIVNKNASGNFSVETFLESNTTEFAGNVSITASVNVTPTTTVAGGGVSGGGVGTWDSCAIPRTYIACVRPGECFYATEPKKGENFTSYFASLNITDEYIYGLIQFEGCRELTKEWLDTFKKDNITLFDVVGDRTFYFKAPRSVLTTKSYDFIRWAGVVENPELKVESELRKDVISTPNESIRFIITAYEVPTEKQYQLILNRINMLPPYSGRDIYMSVIANASQVLEIAKLNFVRKIDKWYDVFKE